jgi:glycine cleavage system H protein
MVKDGLVYTKEHEWVRAEGGTAVMGITDYAQEHLGEITFVELPKVGRVVRKGEALATVESAKAAADVYAPIAGEVTEVNAALTGRPELINEDCYDQGWMCRIRMSGGMEGLMMAEQYQDYVSSL